MEINVECECVISNNRSASHSEPTNLLLDVDKGLVSEDFLKLGGGEGGNFCQEAKQNKEGKREIAECDICTLDVSCMAVTDDLRLWLAQMIIETPSSLVSGEDERIWSVKPIS